MPYYRIIIHLQNGAKRTGLRHYFLEEKYIRAEIKQKTEEALGEYSVQDIDLEELAAESSEVIEYILTRKQTKKRPRPGKSEWKLPDRS